MSDNGLVVDAILFFMRRDLVERVCVGGLAFAAFLSIAACGNEGSDTSCSDYVHMSMHDRQSAVDKSFGFRPSPRIRQQLVDQAFANCNTHEASTVSHALGP